MTREERKDAIDIIQSILDKYEEDECLVTEITIGDGDIKAFKMAIKALEQEPKIVPIAKIKYDEDKLKELVNKAVLTVTSQEPILGKIRAEIDKIYEREGSSFDCLNALDELKEFIDKYKADKEQEDGNE